MAHPHVPPALAVLTARHAIDIDTWTSQGRLDLRVDERTRVRMRPGRRGQEIVLETRLIPLPSSAQECEDLLARAMLRVTARAGRHVGVLALSADGEQLLLQAEVEGGDPAGFASALEGFLNDVDDWNGLFRKSPA